MTNPFLAPDRVPPPATRSQLTGTAQPYYPGDPLPNTPVLGTPPGSFVPNGIQQAPSTYAPQPAGTVPPGGWNSTPQQIPGGTSSSNTWPTGIQQASTFPSAQQSVVQVQPDPHSLRFAGDSFAQQQVAVVPPAQPTLQPNPSILPTASQPPISATFQTNGLQTAGVQQATFQSSLPPMQQFSTPVTPIAEPREVRIRAISSDYLSADGEVLSSDGFRPQGTSQVRKPTLINRFAPQAVAQSTPEASQFGFAPNYEWLRGQLNYTAATNSWSLRYLPSQGSDDVFGGELPIANPQALGGLQGGEFVQLRGRVDQPAVNDIQSNAAYTVAVVQRQRI